MELKYFIIGYTITVVLAFLFVAVVICGKDWKWKNSWFLAILSLVWPACFMLLVCAAIQDTLEQI